MKRARLKFDTIMDKQNAGLASPSPSGFIPPKKNNFVEMKQKDMKSDNSSKEKPEGESNEKWVLRLYVAGQTPKALTAFANLKKICDEQLKGKYSIEVIDLMKNPQLGAADQIFALPTLVRKLPVPVRKIIGDLSNTERVIIGLDIVTAN